MLGSESILRALSRPIAAGGAGVLAIAIAMVGSSSCGGNAVFDAPDPKACGSGHGCPMAGCVCDDDSVVLDTTCELGNCRDFTAVCDERCAEFGGVRSAFATPDDGVAIPDCETFCTRLKVNGCELGCDTLFTDCQPPTNCSDAAAGFWRCVTQQAVLVCDDNFVRVEGCAAQDVAMCE